MINRSTQPTQNRLIYLTKNQPVSFLSDTRYLFHRIRYNVGMAAFQVVKLAPEEWRQYKQIRLESLRAEPQAFGSSYANALQRPDIHWQERLIEAQAGEKSWLLFAKENDRIIGIIGAFRAEEIDVVEIVSVYVTGEKRGQGAATALMAAILAAVGKGNIFRKAVLGVNAGQTAAVALYRRFGFQIVAEKSAVQGDGNAYLGYIMEKELRNEASCKTGRSI